MERNVFISYAREDSEFAGMLAGALEDEGFNVWWDEHIEGGSKWLDELERRLQLAGCVVVIWSEHSADSECVQAEAAYGMAEKETGAGSTKRLHNSRRYG